MKDNIHLANSYVQNLASDVSTWPKYADIANRLQDARLQYINIAAVFNSNHSLILVTTEVLSSTTLQLYKMSDAAAAPASPAKPVKKAAKKPTKPKAPAAHPPVAEMVTAAIKALKDRKGSSLPAIKKYLSANYKVDVGKLAPFIKKFLRSSVAAGKLVQVKGTGASGSFKLSAAAKAEKPKTKKPAAKKPAAKKSPAKAKKPAAKKPAAKKPAAKKSPAKAKKPAAKPKKAAAKKPAAKKPAKPAKKSPKKAKKPAAKKAAKKPKA